MLLGSQGKYPYQDLGSNKKSLKILHMDQDFVSLNYMPTQHWETSGFFHNFVIYIVEVAIIQKKIQPNF
jgi:hypothetical protein